MALYQIKNDELVPVSETSFAEQGIREREHLQQMLLKSIELVAPGTMVIAQEFDEWDGSKRRTDILCIDKDANLVVVELKRNDDGGHMELQSLRYAAMVSQMTFEQLVDIHGRYLAKNGGSAADAEAAILDFLGWDHPDEERFGNDVRIVLVSKDFSQEITTTALWLNERDLDIRCVRMRPHELDGRVVVNIEQCLPLPSAEQYQIKVRAKSINRRESLRTAGEPTGYWFVNVGDHFDDAGRSWDDCKKYGYLSAGGGPRWIGAIRRLPVGEHVFAYASGSGYVGYGRITAEAVPQRDFVVPSLHRKLVELPLEAKPNPKTLDDLGICDWCAGIEWISTRDRSDGVLSEHAYRNTACQIKQPDVVRRLLEVFEPDETNRPANVVK